MPGAWIELDRRAQVVRAHADQRDAVLAMRVEGRVRERLALVLAEELRVAQLDRVDLVARVTAVDALPFVGGALALPAIGRVCVSSRNACEKKNGSRRSQSSSMQCVAAKAISHKSSHKCHRDTSKYAHDNGTTDGELPH